MSDEPPEILEASDDEPETLLVELSPEVVEAMAEAISRARGDDPEDSE